MLAFPFNLSPTVVLVKYFFINTVIYPALASRIQSTNPLSEPGRIRGVEIICRFHIVPIHPLLTLQPFPAPTPNNPNNPKGKSGKSQFMGHVS